MERLKPSECIIAKSTDISQFNLAAPVTRFDDYHFEIDTPSQTLLDHFKVATLDGFGCNHLPLAVRAAGAIIQYLQETQKNVLGQLTGLATYSTETFMALDAQTQRNLELFQNSRSGNAAGSLLSVIDLTRTAMGGRLLKKWLGQPLLDISELKQRQDGIGWFVGNSLSRNQGIFSAGGISE